MLIGSVQKIRILQILKAFLKRWYWFVKINRETNPCKILPHIVFDHRPKTYPFLLLNWVRKLLSPFNMDISRIVKLLFLHFILIIKLIMFSECLFLTGSLFQWPMNRNRFSKKFFCIIEGCLLFIWSFLKFLFFDIVRRLCCATFWNPNR